MGRLSLRLKMLVNVFLLGRRGDLVDEPILASNDCVWSVGDGGVGDRGGRGRRGCGMEGVGDRGGRRRRGWGMKPVRKRTSTTKHTPTLHNSGARSTHSYIWKFRLFSACDLSNLLKKFYSSFPSIQGYRKA